MKVQVNHGKTHEDVLTIRNVSTTISIHSSGQWLSELLPWSPGELNAREVLEEAPATLRETSPVSCRLTWWHKNLYTFIQYITCKLRGNQAFQTKRVKCIQMSGLYISHFASFTARPCPSGAAPRWDHGRTRPYGGVSKPWPLRREAELGMKIGGQKMVGFDNVLLRGFRPKSMVFWCLYIRIYIYTYIQIYKNGALAMSQKCGEFSLIVFIFFMGFCVLIPSVHPKNDQYQYETS